MLFFVVMFSLVDVTFKTVSTGVVVYSAVGFYALSIERAFYYIRKLNSRKNGIKD